ARGRGPSVTGRVVLGPAGLPRLLEVRGHDYFKNAVAERFSTDGGQAAWHNSAEQGTAPPTPPAFYSSLDGAPGEFGVLARALLAAPGHRLPLLPAGEARIDSVGALAVCAVCATRLTLNYSVTL